MTPVWWVFLAACATLAGVVVTALVTRRNHKDSTGLTGLVALSEQRGNELARVYDRLDSLRERMDQVEKKLDEEQTERRRLADILRSAWAHILRQGDQIRDLGGEPQQAPPELTAWMSQDGLVVDRVETTVSRTVVTDTRTGDQVDMEGDPYNPLLDSPDARAGHSA